MRRKYGRPTRPDLFLMMWVNGLAALVVLAVVFGLFGVEFFFPAQLSRFPLAADETPGRWAVVLCMLPGAGIGYGCLWYWLILRQRAHHISWGGACLYGLAVGMGSLISAGLLFGLIFRLELAPLFMLLMLAMLILVPPLQAAMIAFGLTMGLLNGWLAQRWIDHYRADR
jgi:hypothetical protein